MQLPLPAIGTFEIKIPSFKWKQVDGDSDPAAYGGTIAECDGSTITLLKIQPVREYVGDDARDIGFPFWTREACYDLADLQGFAGDPRGCRGCVGMDDEQLQGMDPETRAIALACAAMDYGEGTDEGPAGWARDILGDRRVRWYHGKRPQGWRYLASEDQEFRRFMKEG